MTIGFILFLTGLVCLVVVSVFFAWEARRGTRVCAAARERGDRAVRVVYRTLVFGEIPHVYRTSFVARLRRALHQVVHSLILLLRAIERPLARFSRRMTYSERITAHDARTPSPFLKDMARREEDGKTPENRV